MLQQERKASGASWFETPSKIARHHPRRRVIQYAAAFLLDHQRRRVLGRPVKPGDDDCL
jgi:hypothetical protein